MVKVNAGSSRSDRHFPGWLVDRIDGHLAPSLTRSELGPTASKCQPIVFDGRQILEHRRQADPNGG